MQYKRETHDFETSTVEQAIYQFTQLLDRLIQLKSTSKNVCDVKVQVIVHQSINEETVPQTNINMVNPNVSYPKQSFQLRSGIFTVDQEKQLDKLTLDHFTQVESENPELQANLDQLMIQNLGKPVLNNVSKQGECP